MRLAHLLWVTGLIVAPVGGWWTAKLRDSDWSMAYLAQKPVQSSDESALSEQPAMPAEPTDELARLLSAIGAPDVDTVIANYKKLENDNGTLTRARDATVNALSKVGADSVGAAVSKIRDLDQRLSQYRRTHEVQKVAGEVGAQCDAQGCCCESCTAVPVSFHVPVVFAPIDLALGAVCYE